MESSTHSSQPSGHSPTRTPGQTSRRRGYSNCWFRSKPIESILSLPASRAVYLSFLPWDWLSSSLTSCSPCFDFSVERTCRGSFSNLNSVHEEHRQTGVILTVRDSFTQINVKRELYPQLGEWKDYMYNVTEVSQNATGYCRAIKLVSRSSRQPVGRQMRCIAL